MPDKHNLFNQSCLSTGLPDIAWQLVLWYWIKN